MLQNVFGQDANVERQAMHVLWNNHNKMQQKAARFFQGTHSVYVGSSVLYNAPYGFVWSPGGNANTRSNRSYCSKKLMPHDRPRIIWNSVVAAAIVLTLLSVPFRAAFMGTARLLVVVDEGSSLLVTM